MTSILDFPPHHATVIERELVDNNIGGQSLVETGKRTEIWCSFQPLSSLEFNDMTGTQQEISYTVYIRDFEFSSYSLIEWADIPGGETRLWEIVGDIKRFSSGYFLNNHVTFTVKAVSGYGQIHAVQA